MKPVCWLLFILAVVSFLLGLLEASYLLPLSIFMITPGGYLRASNTFLLFAITLYLLKKP